MSDSLRYGNAIAPQLEDERELVTLWLDMHRSEFEPLMTQFLEDLGAEIDVPASSLWVVRVEDGCTKVTLSVKKGQRARIQMLAVTRSERDELEGEAKSPLIMTFKQRYRVVYVYDPLEKGRAPHVVVRVKVQDWSDGRTVTWLHLSDVHVKANSNSAVLLQDETLGQLSKQLPKLLDFWKLSPDFIFFTGDVAHSGRPDEYGKAFQFFEEIHRSLSPNPRFFFVPGNHDVNWAQIDEGLEKEITTELQRATTSEAYGTTLAQYLLDDDHAAPKQALFERLRPFRAFIDAAGTLGQPKLNRDYFYTGPVDANGVKLAIAGLNSAWRSGFARHKLDEHADIGQLVVGYPQMKRAMADTDASNADVSIALLHHPPASEWFNSFEQPLQRQLLQPFDFILHGHQHDDHDAMLRHPDGDDTLVMSAGALYVGGGYPKTFKAVRLNLDACLYQVYFWRFIFDKQSWVPDSGPFWPLGYLQAALGPKLRNRHLKARATRPRRVTSVPDTLPVRVGHDK